MLKLNIQMFADVGTLTINTELKTEQFEDDVEDLVDIAESKGEESGNVFTKGFSKAGGKIKNVLSNALSKASGVGKGLLKVISSIGSIVVSIGLKFIGIGIAMGVLFGGVMLVVNAFKKLTEENEQFKTNIQYIIWAIGKALEPAVNMVANVLIQIVKIIVTAIKYVAVLIKMLTGHNIFANASAKQFADHLQNAEDSAGGISSNLKDAKKQLAGFDEMNVLQDTSSTGGGGGVGLASQDFTMPDFDLSDLTKEEKNFKNFIKGMKDEWKELSRLVDETPIEDYINEFGLYGISIKGVLQSVYGQWEIWLGQWDIVGGLYDLIVAFFTGDQEGITNALNKIWEGVQLWAKGSQDRVWGILEILAGLVLGSAEATWNALVGFFKGILDWIWESFLEPIWNNIQETFAPEIEFIQGIWNGIKEIIDGAVKVITSVVDTIWSNIQIMIDNVKKIIDWVVGKAKEILKPYVDWIKTYIITPIKDWFTKMWDNIVDKVRTTVQAIKDRFSSIVDFFKNIIDKVVSKFRDMGQKVGDTIGSALKGAINSVLGIAESVLNAPIRAINKLISKINEIPGISLTKLNTFSLPRLAKGGIINMPGRGVPVGSAIAGERGQEAVLPLTDSQQMALLGEAIGKYITINANITNTMNGRVISKELQKIQAENDFAYNR